MLLSKGHAATALYAVYAGIDVLDDTDIENFCEPESLLQSHPEPPLTLIPTGSLGNGISIANGIILASRIRGSTTRVAVVIGDGELNEGSVWEAIATASHHKLWEIIVLVDANGRQLSGPSSSIKNMEPLAGKFEAFGWRVFEADNRLEDIVLALRKCEEWSHSPSVIIVRWDSANRER